MANLNEIRPDLEEIRRDLEEIRPNLDEISPNLDRSNKIIPTNYFNRWRKLFPVKLVEIGFPCSNLSNDPPVLDFGIEDSPPTVAGIRSAGSQAELAGLGGWVGYQVWLDTPKRDDNRDQNETRFSK